MGETFDIAVIGAGLAGSAAALAVAQRGYKTALVAPRPAAADGRTTALMMPSIELLERLGVWPEVRAAAAPLRAMRIIDATSRLVRAPTVTFHASELEIDAFGFNIPNAPLLEALTTAVESCADITCYPKAAISINEDAEQAQVILEDGSAISAKLVVGADGRNSKVREAARIRTHDWSYPQTAVVLNFSHEYPHADTSNEFHTESGPFTQVPLPGRMSSLVWALSPAEAEIMQARPKGELAVLIEERMHSILGKVAVESAVQRFAFSGMIARSFGRGRMVLVGEAGHVFPPIGAQGLNLGLRDVLAFVAALDRAGGPANAIAAVRGYDRARRSDVVSRTASVDMLNRTLLHDFLPVQVLRSGGLAALSAIAPLRVLAMREGMEPGSGFSFLRRPQGRERHRPEAGRR
ncbi:UbiH/UbiF family hydroxylase [Nitratireductor sp. XY-223]|uniref:UbiH/UbiF family hydroxylase n=1 Tax=Nitratireductor sp. XY-223 TaxID=2561926 RepID=UPI0010AA0C21|nr:UbiH/UbiF family hydroxylase [Nitratireductor sp. XY-223]